MKVKSLLKEDYDINDAKTKEQHDVEESSPSKNEKMNLINLENQALDGQSKKLTVYTAGYIASKIFTGIEECKISTSVILMYS